MLFPEEEHRRRFTWIAGIGVAVLVLAYLFVYRPLRPSEIPDADGQVNEVNRLAASKNVEGLKQAIQSRKYGERASARAVQAYAQSYASGNAGTTSDRSNGVTALQQFMQDQRATVRAEAVRGWAYVSPGRDVASMKPLLGAVAHDPSPQVRSAGLQAIASIKSWDALPVVLDRMLDPDASVRQTAMATFEEVAFLKVGKSYRPEDAPDQSRAAVNELRQWQARPANRQMYEEFVNAQQKRSGVN